MFENSSAGKIRGGGGGGRGELFVRAKHEHHVLKYIWTRGRLSKSKLSANGETLGTHEQRDGVDEGCVAV